MKSLPLTGRVIRFTLPLLLLACDPSGEDDGKVGSTTEEGGGGTDDAGEGSSGSGDEGSGDESGSGSGDGSGSGSGSDGGEDGTTDTGGSGGEGSSGDDGSTEAMEVTPEELEGSTWQLELSTATISDPPGVGAILTSVFTDSLLYGVTASTPSSLEMAVAVGAPSGSGFVVGSVLPLGSTDFAIAPDFAVDGTDSILYYDYAGVAIPFEDPVFTGTMAVDGSQLDTARLTARIDTREIGPLFGLESTETATCEFVSALGIICEVCSDGEPLCLDFDAAWTDAPLLEGIVLE